MNRKQISKAVARVPEPEAFKEARGKLDVTLIDQWLAEHYTGPQDVLGKEGLLAQLTKAVVERALSAELTHHLGYAPSRSPAHSGTLAWFSSADSSDRWSKFHAASRTRATIITFASPNSV